MVEPINLTSLAVRHRLDMGDSYGFIDPRFGTHEAGVPIAWDPVKLAYRPFSSFVAVANAVAGFAGWTTDFVWPQPDGVQCGIQIIRRAQVELILVTAQAVTTETLLAPVTETVNAVTFVSNFIVDVEEDPEAAIYKVVKVCNCGPCPRIPCPATTAAPTNTTVLSETNKVLVYPTVRTVLAEFNVQYISKSAIGLPGVPGP